VFNTHKDRGRVLLTVRVHSVGWTLLLWVLLIVLVCLPVLALLKPHGWKLSLGLFSLLFLYLSKVHDYLLYPRIKFQEGGVEIPTNRDCRHVRFMRWDQIHRWNWDGDRLILTAGGTVGTGRSATRPVYSDALAARASTTPIFATRSAGKPCRA
jgi:hypothetical protein